MDFFDEFSSRALCPSEMAPWLSKNHLNLLEQEETHTGRHFLCGSLFPLMISYKMVIHLFTKQTKTES